VKLKLVPRRGFTGMITTLGLRFFIGMMALIYINLIWLLVVPKLPVAIPFSASVVLLFVIMIWG
jgi:predicted small integral membrane protein